MVPGAPPHHPSGYPSGLPVSVTDRTVRYMTTRGTVQYNKREVTVQYLQKKSRHLSSFLLYLFCIYRIQSFCICSVLTEKVGTCHHFSCICSVFIEFSHFVFVLYLQKKSAPVIFFFCICCVSAHNLTASVFHLVGILHRSGNIFKEFACIRTVLTLYFSVFYCIFKKSTDTSR